MPEDKVDLGTGCPADTPPTEAGKLRLLTLDGLDGRTAAARRTRTLIVAIETDLGGAGCLSEGVRQLVQRAAVLGTLIENYEAQWLAGDGVELADYLAAINAQRRVLTTIGLDRIAKTVSVDEYIRSRTQRIEHDADSHN